MLLDSGVDVNAPGPGSRTPLYMAAECGHIDIVDALIMSAARLNIPSDYGKGSSKVQSVLPNKHTPLTPILRTEMDAL